MFGRLRQLSFRTQVTSFLLLLTLLLALASGEILRDIETRFLTENMTRQGQHALTLLATTAVDAMITQDGSLLQTVADEAGRNDPDLVELAMVGVEGQVLARWRRPDTSGHELLRLSTPVTLAGERFGEMQAGWDTARINQEIGDHVFRMRMFVALAMLVLIGSVLLLVRSLAIAPLSRIRLALESLSEHVPPRKDLDRAAASKELNLIVHAVRDLAAAQENLVEARHQAEAANRAKSEFLSTMSHEIRTPLNGILGMTELSLASGVDTKQRERLLLVRQSGKSLLKMTDNILEFVRLENVAPTPGCDPVSPAGLARDLVESKSRVAQEKGLSLSVQSDEGVPEVIRTTQRLLHKVLDQLLDNAIKFTRQGEIRVLLSYDAGAGEVAIQVRDTGIGIPDEARGRIFQAFSQADSSTSRSYGGMGIGLAIVQRQIRALGGRIEMESEAGKGSRFTVILPAGTDSRRGPGAATAVMDGAGSRAP